MLFTWTVEAFRETECIKICGRNVRDRFSFCTFKQAIHIDFIAFHRFPADTTEGSQPACFPRGALLNGAYHLPLVHGTADVFPQLADHGYCGQHEREAAPRPEDWQY